MASSEYRYCGICSNNHVATYATVCCPECDESFCKKCQTHHDVANATKKHETISIKNALKLPKFVREIKYKCTDHNERFVYFCYTHERPCCIECLKDKLHSGFCSSVNVDTAVKHVKQSASFLDLKITLSDLLTNLSRIIEHIGANLQELSKQKVTCADEIRLARESINSYLDQLEKDLSNTMEETLTSKELELQNVLADLELRKTRVNEMHADVNIIKDAASNFQTFMSIPKYIKPAHSQENALQSLCETESFNWSSILVNPTSIQAIKDNLTSFGTVRVKRNACNIGMKVQKSRQAQLTATGFFSKTIETMEFKEVYQNQIQDGHDILDCGILPNGDLLFSDRSKKCLIKCDTRSAFVQIDLPFLPVRFTIVDKNNIAVTSKKQLHIVKLDDHNYLNSKTFHFEKN